MFKNPEGLKRYKVAVAQKNDQFQHQLKPLRIVKVHAPSSAWIRENWHSIRIEENMEIVAITEDKL